MQKFLAALILLAVIVGIVACGDDDAVNTLRSPVVGTWMFDSSSINGVVSATPDDTLTYRADYTGSYRSEIGWGPYDFDFSMRNDSLFITRTSGQDAGLLDTCAFEIQGSHLTETRTSSTEVRVRYLTKQ